MAKTKAKTKGAAKKPTSGKKPTKKTPKKKAAPKKTAPKKAAPKKTAPKKAAPKKAPSPPPQPVIEVDLPTADEIDAAWDSATSDLQSAGTAPRGIALVEDVIKTLDASDASPLAADAIANLALPNGKPLPPSLARMLAFDASELIDDSGQLKFMSLTELMRQEFDEETAAMYQSFEALLPGHCLLLEGGSDSRRFMYVGEPDALGEYPVFVVDTDDIPYVCIAYPGLDLYLADGNVLNICSGTYEDCASDARYKGALEDQARRNFHGLLSVELGANVEAVPGVDPDAALATIWGDG